MPGESASDLLARARQSGLFPDSWLDELTDIPSEEALRRLRERDAISLDQRSFLDSTPSEPSAIAELVPVPQDDAGEAFVPDAVSLETPFAPSPINSPVRTRVTPPMDRQTMWTWFVFGGALWLVGFLVLGIWLGGCFDSSTPSSPKNGRSAP